MPISGKPLKIRLSSFRKKQVTGPLHHNELVISQTNKQTKKRHYILRTKQNKIVSLLVIVSCKCFFVVCSANCTARLQLKAVCQVAGGGILYPVTRITDNLPREKQPAGSNTGVTSDGNQACSWHSCFQ